MIVVRYWPQAFAVVVLPLLLAACQSSTSVPETTVAAPPVVAPKPVRVARAVRPKRPEVACKGTDLSARRKEALFRQFAAAQDGAEIAAAPEPPQPQAGCRPGEK